MLKKMRYVYTVYEEKSFSKAAERLFVSQPSLSAMVKKVESDYGITIFDRTTTPVSLTPEGEYYIHTAKRVLKLETDMRQHFRECAIGLTGSVTLGGSRCSRGSFASSEASSRTFMLAGKNCATMSWPVRFCKEKLTLHLKWMRSRWMASPP